jgi:predicted  nucleic acid-binding Zn-ribbon protein
MSDTLMYSSSTTEGTTVLVEKVEHARPTQLRVNDPRYGLKTAAHTAWEKKTNAERRAAFIEQRQAALENQRNKAQERLNGVRAEIAEISAKASNTTDKSRIRNAITAIEYLGKSETKLVEEVARLTRKIG